LAQARCRADFPRSDRTLRVYYCPHPRYEFAQAGVEIAVADLDEFDI
jgi:hypothetical protein